MNLKGIDGMSTQTETARFQVLRDQSLIRALSAAESDELKRLESALIQEEAQTLAAGARRTSRRVRDLEIENRKLEELLAEKESLAQRLAAAVDSFQAERRALNTRLRRIVSAPKSQSTAASNR